MDDDKFQDIATNCPWSKIMDGLIRCTASSRVASGALVFSECQQHRCAVVHWLKEIMVVTYG
jgi:hypothetical protein